MPHDEPEYDRSIAPTRGETRALVLLAEPDAERCTTITHVLQQADYAVQSVQDPAQVAAEAGRVLPDLIIARVDDPLVDGFSVCRALRGVPETRDIPLLILTRLDDMYAREQIVRAGATAILIEPLRRTLLVRQVRRLLARGARMAHSRSTSWSAGAFTVNRAAS